VATARACWKRSRSSLWPITPMSISAFTRTTYSPNVPSQTAGLPGRPWSPLSASQASAPRFKPYPSGCPHHIPRSVTEITCKGYLSSITSLYVDCLTRPLLSCRSVTPQRVAIRKWEASTTLARDCRDVRLVETGRTAKLTDPNWASHPGREDRPVSLRASRADDEAHDIVLALLDARIARSRNSKGPLCPESSWPLTGC
jgi:hypothetical protein